MAVTKNDLKNYRKMLLELDQYDMLIEEAHNTYKSPALTSNGTGSRRPSDPTTRALRRIERLEEQRDALLRKTEEIEDFADSIDDIFERLICKYRYIQGYTWDATVYQLRKHHSISVVFDYDANWWKKREEEATGQ